MKKVFYMAVLTILCSVGAVQTAHAACSNPAGVEGEQVYNTTHKVMQFCNSTDWIRMGSSDTNGTLPTCVIGDYLIMTAGGFDCETGPPPATPGAKQVFVTASTYNGDLNGRTGADSKCAARATAAGLSGTFKAWIADSNSVTNQPYVHFTQHPGEYRFPNGVKLANNFADLAATVHEIPFNIDESGNTVPDSQVWTNVTPAGYIDNSGRDCQEWQSSNSGTDGNYGLTAATDDTWTLNTGSSNCNQLKRLFCVEQ